MRVQAKHITTELEQHIREELAVLQLRLLRPGMDAEAFKCNMIHQRIQTLDWVLRESRQELRA